MNDHRSTWLAILAAWTIVFICTAIVVIGRSCGQDGITVIPDYEIQLTLEIHNLRYARRVIAEADMEIMWVELDRKLAIVHWIYDNPTVAELHNSIRILDKSKWVRVAGVFNKRRDL